MQFSTLFLTLSALVISSGQVEAAPAPRGCRHHSVHTVTKWYNAPTNIAAVASANASASANSTLIAEPTPTAVNTAPTSEVTEAASTSSPSSETSSVAEESSAAAATETSSASEQDEDYEDTSSAISPEPTSTPAEASSAASAPSSSAAAPAPSATGAGSSDAQTLVKLHNDFRAQYGAGPVTWSDELASYAASHATACNMEHTHGPYGENLAAGVGGGYSITDAFNAWAAEAPEYDPSNPQYSHFTQVVWKGTTEIGCAAISCPSGSIFDMSGDSLYVMCEYNPPGNMIGAFPENVGSKTS